MRFWVLAMLCLVALVCYVQRLSFNVAEESVRTSLAIDKDAIGRIMGAWAVGYALLQVPSGWAADRWGPRCTLAALAVLWSALTALAGQCRSETELLAVWFGMGAAQAGAFPCAAKAIGQRFPATQRATASGALASAMAVGSVVAPLLATRLLDTIDWREMLAWLALPGFAWAALFWLATDDPEPSDATEPGPAPWAEMAVSVPMWLLCGQQFFRAAAMAFFYTWFPTYWRVAHGADLRASGDMAALVGAGAMLGGLLGGTCSDAILLRTGRRRLARQGLAVLGMASCAGLICASYFVADARAAIGLLAAGAFLATFGGVSGYTVAIELGGRNVATVFSVMNMCGNLGAALFPTLVGAIVASHARAGDEAAGWAVALFLCAGIFALDAVCWALLNPKRPLAA